MPLLLMRQCQRPGTTSSAAGGDFSRFAHASSFAMVRAAFRRRRGGRPPRSRRAYFVVEIVNFTS